MVCRKASRRRARVQPGLLKVLDTIRLSFWFIPGVGMWCLQKRLGSDWHKETDGYQSTAMGPRKVLSTIASSAINVAAVVLSGTTVAASFAVGRDGPRIVLAEHAKERLSETLEATLPAIFEKG
jgi:uncharacterized membrane protein